MKTNNQMSIDAERKLGMIKASGYIVILDGKGYCSITIGNDQKLPDSTEELEEFIDKKYKEIVQND